ncbi:MAG: ClpXP protease specificity-enhancing factor SspB [Pseudomonadota bacterium]
MAKDYIRYDLLAQEALRGVVRKVLSTAAQQGLPGEHHFYISIATTVPGVMLSQRLREQYPDEMTIILQHQFWDLDLTETEFSVTLSFGGSPERLTVPFAAIKGFFDPSVQFGLEFVVGDEARAVTDPDAGDAPPAVQPSPPAGPDASNDSDADSEAAQASNGKTSDQDPDTADDAEGDGATVVSLDAFRRKG